MYDNVHTQVNKITVYSRHSIFRYVNRITYIPYRPHIILIFGMNNQRPQNTTIVKNNIYFFPYQFINSFFHYLPSSTSGRYAIIALIKGTTYPLLVTHIKSSLDLASLVSPDILS